LDKLPPKSITNSEIKTNGPELDVYEEYEGLLLNTLAKIGSLQKNPHRDDPLWNLALETAMQKLIAFMQLARMSLLHKAVPNGRELTKRFSPTRCKLKEVTKRICVHCESKMAQEAKMATALQASDADGHTMMQNRQGPEDALIRQDDDTNENSEAEEVESWILNIFNLES